VSARSFHFFMCVQLVALRTLMAGGTPVDR
jgi:hypothetical protein